MCLQGNPGEYGNPVNPAASSPIHEFHPNDRHSISSPVDPPRQAEAGVAALVLLEELDDDLESLLDDELVLLEESEDELDDESDLDSEELLLSDDDEPLRESVR